MALEGEMFVTRFLLLHGLLYSTLSWHAVSYNVTHALVPFPLWLQFGKSVGVTFCLMV